MADSTVPATAAGCSRLCWCHQQVELTRSAPVSHPFPPSLLVIPRACRRHANRPCLPRVRTLSEAALVCMAQEHQVTRSRGASLSSVSAGLSSFVNERGSSFSLLKPGCSWKKQNKTKQTKAEVKYIHLYICTRTTATLWMYLFAGEVQQER